MPASAEFWGGLEEQACMANAYLAFDDKNSLPKDALNCTANDVEITKVIPLTGPAPDGVPIDPLDPDSPQLECIEGDPNGYTIWAHVEVKTNANSRWDSTFYLPNGEWDAQTVQSDPNNNCSLLVGKSNASSGNQGDPDFNLDGDDCSDIKKPPQTVVHEFQELKLFCIDGSNNTEPDGLADFRYCAAWDNIERDNCEADVNEVSSSGVYGQVPNTKSKCNCDLLNIPVFVKPKPPTIIKELISTSSIVEPGGDYTFRVSFKNPNPLTSLFITSLSDFVDEGADGSYGSPINLWGATTTKVPGIDPDGVYLKDNAECSQPPAIDGGNPGEILGYELDGIDDSLPSYECTFTVTIIDSNLPDKILQTDVIKELYDDVVKVVLVDKNGSEVINGDSCTSTVGGIPGDHCNVVPIRVDIFNAPPGITVTKTANPSGILEPGGDVEFTITIENGSIQYPSTTWDSPLTLISLMDDVYLDLLDDIDGECKNMSKTINYNDKVECKFTKEILGDADSIQPVHSNLVTAIAVDNENDQTTDSDNATVSILDVPSAIILEKTANPESVLETGDDPNKYSNVDYTFKISVKKFIPLDPLDPDGPFYTAVDDVDFYSLDDDKFGELKSECLISYIDGVLQQEPWKSLELLTLSPGHNASCKVTKGIQGNYSLTNPIPHTNKAIVYGQDTDDLYVEAMDTATVTFLPRDPDADLGFATSMVVVLRMHNNGPENLTLSSINIKDINILDEQSVFDEDEVSSFKLLDISGKYRDLSATMCEQDHLLTYNDPDPNVETDTYTCAFVIALKPGLDSTDNNDLLGEIRVVLVDNEGTEAKNSVSMEVHTIE